MFGEFLDTEWYQQRQLPKPPLVEGWERSSWALTTVVIPTVIARKLAQVDRLAYISLNEADQIDVLVASLAERGFDQPMVVVIDKHGRMVLKDGHHRLAAVMRLGRGEVPVRFVESGRISSPTAQPVATMLPALLLAVSK